MAESTDNKDAAKGAASAGNSGGGFKAWLPLGLVIVLMPALAYLMTSFVLLPKLQKSLGVASVSARESGGETGGQGAKSEGGHGGAVTEGAKGPRTKVPITKIIVNVSGSLGSRMLLASFTLVGSAADFKAKVEENTDQLRDVASGILSAKTISDLEKAEARNLIRAELLAQLNTILGGIVQEIYITEFAIQ
jgi:flagellar basal body-associated protein FliL